MTRPRFLADENVKGSIVKGLRGLGVGIDIVCAQEAGLSAKPDESVLAWAAAEGRAVVTHDAATMPRYANQRIADEQPMPGLCVVPWSMPIGEAIEELHLIYECSYPDELHGRVIFLPM